MDFIKKIIYFLRSILIVYKENSIVINIVRDNKFYMEYYISCESIISSFKISRQLNMSFQ